MMHLDRTAFVIGNSPGLALALSVDGARVGSAELMLPADDDAVNAAIDTLVSQASRRGVQIRGNKRQALFHQIEMGAVT
ncbi:MAG: hypothetical protein EBR45_01585 [Betaproteobacteria bacterium]|nr:hypothetical protein [Betaproteobacteria bacterium]